MENTQQVEEPKAPITEVKFGDQGNENQQAEQVEGINNQEFDNTGHSSWDADTRYKDYWKEDPNNLYQTLRQEEKAKKGYQNQINDYKTKVESLKEYEENWKVMQEMANHPTIGPRFSQMMNEFNEFQGVHNEAQTQNQVVNNGVYDPNQQFNQYLQPIQQKLHDIELWKNDLMNHVNQQNAQQVKDQQFEVMDQMASENGFTYNKDDFIQSMQVRGIPVEHWAAQFSYEAFPQIKSNLVAQASESALNNANATQSMAGAGDKVVPSGEGLSFRDRLTAATYVPMP